MPRGVGAILSFMMKRSLGERCWKARRKGIVCLLFRCEAR